jgi:hypothetical protein
LYHRLVVGKRIDDGSRSPGERIDEVALLERQQEVGFGLRVRRRGECFQRCARGARRAQTVGEGRKDRGRFERVVICKRPLRCRVHCQKLRAQSAGGQPCELSQAGQRYVDAVEDRTFRRRGGDAALNQQQCRCDRASRFNGAHLLRLVLAPAFERDFGEGTPDNRVDDSLLDHQRR